MEQEQQQQQEPKSKPKKKRVPTFRNQFSTLKSGAKLKWTDDKIQHIVDEYKKWMFKSESHIFFDEFLLTVFSEDAPSYYYFINVLMHQPQFKDEWKYIKAIQEMRLKKGLIMRNSPFVSKGCQFLLQTNFDGYIPRTEVVEINDNIQLEFNPDVLTADDKKIDE